MIRHDFECAEGHIFEATVESDVDKLRCRETNCKRTATRVFLPPRVSRAAQAFKPTVFYQRKDGEIFVPGRSDDHLPKKLKSKLERQGYQQRTITNFREYERFRREHTEHIRARDKAYQDAERERYDQERARNFDELRRGFTMTRDDGSTVHMRAADFSGMGQAILERALQDTEYQNDPSPEFYIDAYENDNPRYNDRDTNYRDRRV